MHKRTSTIAVLLLAVAWQLLMPPDLLAAQRSRSQRPRSRPAQTQPRPQPPPSTISRPDLVVQSGHSDNIRAAAFSPDGNIIASASSDKTIRLWEAGTGRMLRVMDHHRDSVTSIAFSPDGRSIVSGSLDKSVAVCDVKTGRVTRSLVDHSDEVNAVAVSPDGKTLASGSRDETINLWDAKTGGILMTIDEPPSEVRAVAFSPDGTLLASANADSTIRFWQVSDGELIATLEGHSSPVRALAFSPDGRLVASGGDDKLVKLWVVSSGQVAGTLRGHSSIVTSLAFSQNGTLLYSGSHDKSLRVWDLQNVGSSRTLQTASSPITALSLDRDDHRLAVASWVNLDLLDRGSGEPIRTLEGGSSGIRDVAFSADGKTLAYAAGDGVKLWDTGSGGLARSLVGHSFVVHAVAFSPNDEILASASADLTIRLWDLATNKTISTLRGHLSSVTAVAFGGDGRVIASGSIDRNVRLWDAKTGKALGILEGHHSLISALVFAPDGESVASGGYDNTIKLWDVANGKEIRTIAGPDSEVTDLDYHPGGEILASSHRDKSVRLWNVATGELLRVIDAHAADVFAVKFSPDGAQLASAGHDKTVRLWNWESGQLVRTLEGHSGPIVALAFDSEGRFICSASEDATVKVWSPRDSQPLTTLASPSSTDWLVITPDGLFDGSPGGWQSILWRFAGDTFDVAPVEAFFSEFYHPALLGDIMTGARPRAAQDLARLDRRQPRLKLSLVDAASEDTRRSIATRRIKVRVEVAEAPPDADHPSGSGAQDVRLFRNGALIKAWRGDALGAHVADVFEETISIVAGENRITAYAFNKDNIKSADSTLVLMGSDSLRRKGTAYILVVGIDEYANPEYNLRYAVADARVFGETVRQQQTRLGKFNRVEVIPLLNEEATRSNILAALGRLAGKEGDPETILPESLNSLRPAEPEDAVLMYFAGHGTAQKTRFYLIPHDLGYAGPLDAIDAAGLNLLLSRGVSDRDLEQAFEPINAGDLLMVIDACNSGQALESEEKRRGPMNSKGLAQLAYEKGLYILTAAQGHQAALEVAELGHGLLTYALVHEGLKLGQADAEPKDNRVMMREWLDYATGRVPQMQADILGGERGLKVVFRPGDEAIADPAKRSVQRPRVFYRREMEPEPLVVGKIDESR